jgi:ABC-type polar amino acid transport system ATPase subunit
LNQNSTMKPAERATFWHRLGLSESLRFDVTSGLVPGVFNGLLFMNIDLAESGMTVVSITHEAGFVKNCAATVAFMHDCA